MIVLKSGVARLRIDEVAFSPCGSVLAAPAASQGVCLWPAFADVPKAEVLKLPIVTSRIAFAPDGKTLYAGNDRLCGVSLPGRAVAGRFDLDAWRELWFAPSPDGSRVVAARVAQNPYESRIFAWPAGEFGRTEWEVPVAGQAWSRPHFAPDGRTFVTCEHYLANRVLTVHAATRSAATGERLHLSPPRADTPDQVVRSPDGSTLAWVVRGAVYLYPAAGDGAEVAVVKNTGAKHFTGVAFHPSGRFLAATSNDETVKLYDTRTWSLARTHTWDIGRMRSVCFSPDGTLAAAGSDKGKVVVWDVDG